MSRPWLVTAIATALAVVVTVFSLGTGDLALSPPRVVEVLFGMGTRREELVVAGLRLPRALLGLVVGVVLAVSGAMVQTIARNSLASPDLLGVTGGASAGAVAVIVLGGSGGQVAGMLRGVGVPLAALLGGLVAAGLVAVFLLFIDASGIQPLLVGIGVSAFFAGLVSWMMIAASIDDAARANVWLTGSLNGKSWPELIAVSSVAAVVLITVTPVAWRLSTLALGPDIAQSLGVRVVPTTTLLLVLAVLLASIATAVSGPIAFVALVAPHLARMTSATARPPLPAAAALGALLVISSDLVARSVLAPIILPVGAVTAAVGAPFLLWLLVRRRKAL